MLPLPPPRRNGNDSLLKMLVAPPHPLAQPHPQALQVAPQQPLPPNLRFGPANPSQTTNSSFSGGVSPSPVNPLHPQFGTMQDYKAPQYSPLTAQPPARALLTTLFPLVASVLAGGGGAGGGGGAPAPPGQIIPGVTPNVTATQYNAYLASQGQPQQSYPTTIRSQAPPVTPTLSGGLLATLAQKGARLGSVGRASRL